MNRQELLKKVVNLEEKYGSEVLIEDTFRYRPGNELLQEEFERNKLGGEMWHQFVRFALSNPEERKYMYERLLRLVLKHQSYGEYFQVKSEFGTYHQMPDRQGDLNKLHILFNEYFDIYKSIINKIHFDYPLQSESSSIIHGKINWDKTIRNSTTKFPLAFDVSFWKREFLTPGNILLVLAAIWLYRESKRLLNTTFEEPLKDDEKVILNLIYENTGKIIKIFPHQQVLAMAKKYGRFVYDDKRILELENNSEIRIKEGIVQNKKYLDLLRWIKKFRELNIRIVSNKTTNFPIETLKDLDTIFEAWIFFELMEYFDEKKMISYKNLKEKQFLVKYGTEVITIFYEKKYKQNKGHAWAVDSWPDFSVEQDGRIIAVFDAKNYGKSSGNLGDAKHKILGYLMNLDADFGGLFFPHYGTEPIEHQRKIKDDVFLKLKVGYFKLQPSTSADAIKEKQQILDTIYEEIRKSILLVVKS